MKNYIIIATLIVIIAGILGSWFKVSRLNSKVQDLQAKNWQLNEDLARLTGKLVQEKQAFKDMEKLKKNCQKAHKQGQKDLEALKIICDESGIARKRLNEALRKAREKKCKQKECVCPEKFPGIKEEAQNIIEEWNR